MVNNQRKKFSKFILNFFSIDVIVFKVAGGILLLITGIRMVDGSNTQLSDKDDGEGTPFQLAKARFRKIMVPMAIPTIVGPGSLTTVILFGSGLSGFMDYGVLSIVLIVSLLILFIILAVAPWLEEKVDPIVFTAITRLFGIIVTAIALQFILEGLGDAFPNWLNESSPVEDAEGKSASKN